MSRPVAIWAGAGAWFGALALLVAGPLLAHGYLLLLDFPAGPHAARLSPVYVPSRGTLPFSEPLVLFQLVLQRIDPLLPQRFFLVAPVVVGALGLFRLVRRRFGVGALAATYGGTLFVVNPFVADRYLAGHLYFLLAFALFPWALDAAFGALDAPSARRALAVGLWSAVLAAIAVAVAGMYLLVVLLIAALGRPRSRSAITYVAIAFATAGALCAYWLLPGLWAAPPPPSEAADLGTYASRPSGMAVLPTLAALYGFWRNEFPRAAEQSPALYLLLVPILTFAVLGLFALVAQRRGRDAAALAVAAGIALVLAAATALPVLDDVFGWAYEHIVPLAAYREPQKLVALVVLAYAVFGAVGLQFAVRGARRAVAVLATLVALVAAIGYGSGVLWGFSGEVRLARYPTSWSAADHFMQARGAGSLIVLPRDPYAVWQFSDGRLVAHPARSFFSRDVISGTGASVQSESSDPFVALVNDALADRGVKDLGRRLAPIGVRFVAAAKTGTWMDDLPFLASQQDLKRVFTATDLVLFENTVWRSAPSPLARLELQPPRAPRRELRLPQFDAVSQIGPVGTRYVATTSRCTDAWRLGDERASCHLGAVAAFRSPTTAQPLWTPFATIGILGYAISFMTLGALAVAVGSQRRRERTT